MFIQLLCKRWDRPPSFTGQPLFQGARELLLKDGKTVIYALAEVVGVSSDSEESHQGFASKHRLPFVLLSDKKGALRKQYGVPTTLGVLPGRVTYVIDKQGVVRHIFNDMFNAQKHIGEALKVVQAIAGE